MKGCRPLTDEEIEIVKGCFDGPHAKRNLTMVIYGLRTGHRISEILSLKACSVVGHGKILDRVTVKRQHMKGKLESRTVILHPEVKEALRTYLESQFGDLRNIDPDLYLFRSQKGKNRPLSRQQAWAILEEAFAKAEMTGQLGTHSMRKTFADRVYQKLNGDIFKVKRALNHASILSTLSYLSFKEEEIEQAILSI